MITGVASRVSVLDLARKAAERIPNARTSSFLARLKKGMSRNKDDNKRCNDAYLKSDTYIEHDRMYMNVLQNYIQDFTLWSTNITMENHNLYWENSLFHTISMSIIFNSYASHCQKVFFPSISPLLLVKSLGYINHHEIPLNHQDIPHMC